jgi:hypothetical protein
LPSFEKDVRHHFERAAIIEGLNLDELPVGVVLSRAGKLGFLGGELLDDVLDLRLAGVHGGRQAGAQNYGEQKTHSSLLCCDAAAVPPVAPVMPATAWRS